MKKNFLAPPKRGLTKFIHFFVITLIISLSLYACRKQDLTEPISKPNLSNLPETEKISAIDISTWAENLDIEIRFNLQWSKSEQAVIDGKHVIKIPASETSAMILTKNSDSGVLNTFAMAWDKDDSTTSALNAELIWFSFQDLELHGQKIKNGKISQVLTFGNNENAGNYLTNPNNKQSGDRLALTTRAKNNAEIERIVSGLNCFMTMGYWHSFCENYWDIDFDYAGFNNQYSYDELFFANLVEDAINRAEDNGSIGAGGGGGGTDYDWYNWGPYTQQLYNMLNLTTDETEWLDNNQTIVDHYYNYIYYSSELSLEERKTYSAKSISRMAIDPEYYAFSEKYRMELHNSGRGVAHAWWSDEVWLGSNQELISDGNYLSALGLVDDFTSTANVEIGNETLGGYDYTDYGEYRQNDGWPTISSVIPVKNFITYRFGINCLVLAKEQIAKSGYQISGYFDVGQTYKINTDQGVDRNEAKKAVGYMKGALQSGIPVIVGVDIRVGNPGNHDGKTDHFVVIVGMGTDSNGKFFRFFDSATAIASDGTSQLNKMYYNESTGIIQGTTEAKFLTSDSYLYRSSNRKVLTTITHIRRSKAL